MNLNQNDEFFYQLLMNFSILYFFIALIFKAFKEYIVNLGPLIFFTMIYCWNALSFITKQLFSLCLNLVEEFAISFIIAFITNHVNIMKISLSSIFL